MPLECVAMRCAAQNHTGNGNFERCITVPAVTEAPTTAAVHSQGCARGSSATPRGRVASGAHEAVRPASLEQKCLAARLIRKPA